jgi:hypothetical protein
VVNDSSSLLTLDGFMHGYGQVIGAEAMALFRCQARKRHRRTCVVGLAHSAPPLRAHRPLGRAQCR